MKRSLEITSMIGCPLMCTVCPQDKLKNNYTDDKYLSFDNFKLVIDKLPKDVMVIFSGYAEMWANPNATDMLEYSLLNGFDIAIYTTLYGMKDPQRVVDLIKKHKTQIDQIWIHLPDNSNNMPGYKPSTQYTNALKLLTTVNPMFMTMSDTNEVDISLQDININISNWQFHTRAENVNRSDTIEIELLGEFNNKYVIDCVRNKSLLDNVMLPNGDVTLCCMDYSQQHVLGNLLEESYEEVVTRAEHIIKKNHTLFDDSTLCRTCQDTYHRTPWNDSEVHKQVKQIDKDFKL